MGRVKAERTRDFLQDFMGYIERQFGEGHMAEEYDAPFVRAVSAEFDDGPMKRKAVAAVLLSQQTLHRRLLNEVGIFMKRQVQEKVARDFQTCRLVAPATSAQVQVEDVDLTLQNRWECWG